MNKVLIDKNYLLLIFQNYQGKYLALIVTII